MMGVSQRTISRWERGEDNPSLAQQKHLRDLGWQPTGSLLQSLATSISNCPAPRALSRSERLNLLMLSQPAIKKRPSIANWIGKDLVPIAGGVLREMLDDLTLQRAIAGGEIAGIVATTRSVLDTEESTQVGNYHTTITYFFHDGALFSDAISSPAADDCALGYEPIPMDHVDMPLTADPAGLRARLPTSLAAVQARE